MIAAGMIVRVKREQPGRIGGPKCPGREGEVLSLNSCSRPEKDSGLWNVRLRATNRAKERVDTFWGKDLEILSHPAPEAHA
jgi:hypothetical protein